MIKEFKAFALKGNVVDLAVAVVIGAGMCSSRGVRALHNRSESGVGHL